MTEHDRGAPVPNSECPPDITPGDLELARELIADESGEMLIEYFELIELLRKLADSRDHWRLQVPRLAGKVANLLKRSDDG